jgi:DnaJ-class molecular chaperone
MSALVAEAAAAKQDAARLAEDQRFQRQQAVQAGAEPGDIPAEQPAESSAPRTRTRQPRQLATSGRPCGRCGGGGQIAGEAGFAGACPVCQGEGVVKTWDRSLKVR